MTSPRKIIHIDMDAFYASVEARDDPTLCGIPLAVGHPGPRGVVLTASYAARAYGVRSAMSSSQALRLCPGLRFTPPRFAAYHEVAKQIRAICAQVTDLVEPLSLDEAYLDATEPKRGPASATLLARQLKRDILAETGLTASAGVSCNKFLAKLASDLHKPDGLTVIRPEEADAVVAALPVERFFGIGPVTAARLKDLGLHSGADLRAYSEAQLEALFGRAGRHFYRICRGQDERPVEPNRPHKSVGAETTFAADLSSTDALKRKLDPLARAVERRLQRRGLKGRTITLKVKYADFTQITRSRTLPQPVDTAGVLLEVACDLLLRSERPMGPVRLLGITLSNLLTEGAPVQTPLFERR